MNAEDHPALRTPPQSLPPLDPPDEDACDRCGAHAWVAVWVTAASLYPLRFCHHHFRAYRDALVEQRAFMIRDDSALLHAQERRTTP